MANMVTGATGTQNILPNLKISDMAWKIVSKKRKKKSKRTNKKNV